MTVFMFEDPDSGIVGFIKLAVFFLPPYVALPSFLPSFLPSSSPLYLTSPKNQSLLLNWSRSWRTAIVSTTNPIFIDINNKNKSGYPAAHPIKGLSSTSISNDIMIVAGLPQVNGEGGRE
jgi:hypothetical protein